MQHTSSLWTRSRPSNTNVGEFHSEACTDSFFSNSFVYLLFIFPVQDNGLRVIASRAISRLPRSASLAYCSARLFFFFPAARIMSRSPRIPSLAYCSEVASFLTAARTISSRSRSQHFPHYSMMPYAILNRSFFFLPFSTESWDPLRCWPVEAGAIYCNTFSSFRTSGFDDSREPPEKEVCRSGGCGVWRSRLHLEILPRRDSHLLTDVETVRHRYIFSVGRLRCNVRVCARCLAGVGPCRWEA